MIFEVIVDISNSQVDKVFDYIGEDFFQIGQRVLVPFGGREIEGFIVNVKYDSDVPDDKLKSIIKPLDSYIAISMEMLQMAVFLKRKYNLRMVDVLRLCIPSQMRGGKVKAIFTNVVSLTSDMTAEEIKLHIGNRAKKQLKLVDYLDANPYTKTTDLRHYGTALKELVNKQYVLITKAPKLRTPYSNTVVDYPKHTLTSEQQQVTDTILSDGEGTYLLFGVTGSGKTEVYMNVISNVVTQGKSAIMLVPEISLTPNVLKIFRSRFGQKVAILHSGLSAGERFDEWERLKRGDATIAIGARSAIFAPLNNIGVIIIDEEHDSSYQSDSNPRYDTVEVAKFRQAYNGCSLVMGSATPSLESFYKAEQGEYKLLQLPSRINQRPLPTVEIVDMAAETRRGNKTMFSQKLLDELTDVIAKGNQAMLFVNRRGFSSFIMCKKCGHVVKCKNCDVSLTYHSEENQLICHYCGQKYYMLDVCPNCKSEYMRQGKIGTQQVVAYLNKLFPNIKIGRMDYDTTQTKQSHSDILTAFANRETQILVGTQMIAKGHDFPFVTLVGILDGDQSLYYSDYMSAEKTFQLITQVSGRSGRDVQPGKVVLQTYSPHHYCLQLASRQDYLSFYKKEINLRMTTKFPPFAVVLRLLYVGAVAEDTVTQLNNHFAEIEKLRESYPQDFVYLQRMRCAVKRIDSKFRYQIMIRLENQKADVIIEKIYKIADNTDKSISVFVQINPQNMN